MRWMLYLGIGAVFLLGGVAGAMFGIQNERKRIRELDQQPTVFFVEVMGRKLEKELDLSPEQATKVRAIYDEIRPELFKLEVDRRGAVGKIMESTHPKIRAVLTEAQNKQFDELLERLRQRFREPGPWKNGEKGKDRGRPPGDWKGERRPGEPGGPDGPKGWPGDGPPPFPKPGEARPTGDAAPPAGETPCSRPAGAEAES